MSITVKRAQRTFELVTDLTMLDRIDELSAALATESTTLADPAKSKAARELKAIEKKVDDTTLVFTLRAVTAREFAEAQEAGRVEKDDQHPDGLDWFKVVRELAPAATVSVKWKPGDVAAFDPDADWPELLDSMSDFQVAELLSVIVGLGRETGAGPKAAFARLSSTPRRSAKN